MYQFPDLQVTENTVLIPEGSLQFLICATEIIIHRIIGQLNEIIQAKLQAQ